MAESVMQSYRYCFVSESSCCMDVIPVLFASFTRLEVYGGRVSYPSYNRKWDTLSHHFTPLPSKVGPLSYNAQELSFRSSERNLQAILPTSQKKKRNKKGGMYIFRERKSLSVGRCLTPLFCCAHQTVLFTIIVIVATSFAIKSRRIFIQTPC